MDNLPRSFVLMSFITALDHGSPFSTTFADYLGSACTRRSPVLYRSTFWRIGAVTRGCGPAVATRPIAGQRLTVLGRQS